MVYVFFAEGFEEIEGLTVVDLLRRAEIEVKMTGIAGKEDVTGAHGIRVGMDLSIDDVNLDHAQFLVLPGGMPGTTNLGACKRLTELLKMADQKSIHMGAICAAPSILGDLGILKGRKAVCYPGFENRLVGALVREELVAADGHVITGRSMGAAIDFALAIIEELKGKAEAAKIADAIVYRKEKS